MTAPASDVVVVGPWQQPQKDNANVDLLTLIETLERRQAGRYAARDQLTELIERKQQEITNLKGQL